MLSLNVLSCRVYEKFQQPSSLSLLCTLYIPMINKSNMWCVCEVYHTIQILKLASERVLRPPSLSQPSVVRRCPPSNSPASSGFCAPRGARHNPANRVARFSSSASSRCVKPTRRSPATGIVPDLSQRERRLPLSTFQSWVQCLCVILCFLLSTPLGFCFFLVKNGFFRSCLFILWNSHRYYCQTQLEKLYVLVCFRGVMVSRPRIS